MNYEMYKDMGISEAVLSYSDKILSSLEERFRKIDEIAEYNQAKVLKAMQDNRVSAQCFAGTTGYGHDDMGRDTLEKVYDFDLNMDGGHIEGYFVKDYQSVLESFSKLLDSDRLIKKYSKSSTL